MTKPSSKDSGRARRRVLQGTSAAALGAGAWAALTEGDPASLVIGVPAVALAVAASLRSYAPPPERPLALATFAPFFLKEIFASAWYVASRVFRPRPGFDPGIVTYRLRLRGEPARAAFMISVTLTPGTLSADVRGDELTVHALDRRADVQGALEALEARVADLFSEPLEGSA